jgi:myo-inositol-1-phosphate synthase
MEGTTFGNVPLNCELKLEVWDSPNSAGVVIDAVRCAKLALDRGIGGAIVGPSAYFMKSPPHQFPDHVAMNLTREFIAAQAAGKVAHVAGERTETLHEDAIADGAARHVRAH